MFPMKAISQFVISIFELVEAEGRDLRAAARTEGRDLRLVLVNLALALGILLVTVSLFLAGAGLIIAGLLWWLETQVPRSLAAAITGLVAISLGVGCLLLFRSLTKAKTP
jgi:hypothetical protein